MAETAQKIPLPTPGELEMLKLVWNMKTSTVRDIYEAIREYRKIAYTTVMTMLRIMERKGMVRRTRPVGRAFVYTPTNTQEQVIKEMVCEFVDRVFNNSPEALVGLLD